VGAMITRKMKIRRSLRSARTSALTSEERQMELRDAELRSAQEDGRSGAAVDVAPTPIPGARVDAP